MCYRYMQPYLYTLTISIISCIFMKKKKFATLRAWNRKRNYVMKDIRYYFNLFIEKILWDKSKKTTIDFNSVKTILILRNEGKIGDVIVDTAIIKILSQHGYIIDILVTSTNESILKYNKNIRNIYIANNITLNDFMKKHNHNVSKDVVKKLHENNYDLIIDPSMFNIPIHRPRLLKEISAKNVLSFNKKNWLKHYSKSIYFDYNLAHIKKSYELLLAEFNINEESIEYDICYPNNIDEEIESYLFTLPKNNKNIIVNIFAGSDERCLSLTQAKEIDEKLNSLYNDINIIILDHKKVIPDNTFNHAKVYIPKSLQHTIALISKADLVISPDTSIVHISATFQRPLVAIYKDAIHNNKLWGPGYDNSQQIFVSNVKTYEDNNIVEQIIAASEKYLAPN